MIIAVLTKPGDCWICSVWRVGQTIGGKANKQTHKDTKDTLIKWLKLACVAMNRNRSEINVIAGIRNSSAHRPGIIMC